MFGLCMHLLFYMKIWQPKICTYNFNFLFSFMKRNQITKSKQEKFFFLCRKMSKISTVSNSSKEKSIFLSEKDEELASS